MNFTSQEFSWWSTHGAICCRERLAVWSTYVFWGESVCFGKQSVLDK